MMGEYFLILNLWACEQDASVPPVKMPLPPKEEVEQKATGVPIWTVEQQEKLGKSKKARLFASTVDGKQAFAFSNSWRIGNAPLQTIDSSPILIAWSKSGEELGILVRSNIGYALRIFHPKNFQLIQTLEFALPQPNTKGTYPDPTPTHLVHIPTEGGWAVYNSMGFFGITADGVTQRNHTRRFRDLHGDTAIEAANNNIQVLDKTLPSPCPSPANLVWSSLWKRLVVHCPKQGKNSLYVLDLSNGKRIREQHLGIGISSVSLIGTETVAALERGMLLTWSENQLTRNFTEPDTPKTCSAQLRASEKIEVLAVSKENETKMWAIGPQLGERWSNAPWNLVTVDMKTCTIKHMDVHGKLTVNNKPIWIEKQQAFIAEINTPKRYGPAFVSVHDPASWKYILEENTDPHLYELSSDGKHLAIGSYDWTRIFTLDGQNPTETAKIFPADQIKICSDSISRLRYKHQQWVVHSLNGDVIAVVNSTSKHISCPVPSQK